MGYLIVIAIGTMLLGIGLALTSYKFSVKGRNAAMALTLFSMWGSAFICGCSCLAIVVLALYQIAQYVVGLF